MPENPLPPSEANSQKTPAISQSFRLSDTEAEEVLHRSAKIAQSNSDQHQREAKPLVAAGAIAIPSAFSMGWEEIEARRAERQRWNLWSASGVPARYQQADLDSLSSVPGDVADKYAATAQRLRQALDRPMIVALVGGRGPGKTWMGCGLIRLFCRRLRSAKYLNTAEYFDLVKATYASTATSGETKVEDAYVRPQLLVLDEVHERGETEWEDRKLTRLIDKRYAGNLVTLLISNQTAKEFQARIGSSITDRIRDGGGVIVCDWPSLRGRISPPVLAAPQPEGDEALASGERIPAAVALA